MFRRFILIVSILAMPAVVAAAQPDAGVPYTLADMRKQTIKNLTYELLFRIPETTTLPVAGTATIRFELDSARETVIDFRAERRQLFALTANGRQTACTVVDGQIVVPATALKAGRNVLVIEFEAGNRSLNRNDEFLYTLFVPDRARTVFPCFDQPNLKAIFTLRLELPEAWKAVSNTRIAGETVGGGQRTVSFAPTEPLSTYLFSFVAGKFEYRSYRTPNRTIGAYYRETDPKKIAQLDTIFKQVAASLDWLEEYTGIPYPFAKYDLVILPGFQFGGMEHTGATLYNDTQLFTGDHPTPDEELRRAQLIAHETAHMWFGDLVTMDWFDDVWTKEVFANHFAAAIVEPQFPTVNHRLERLRNFTASALSEDRTQGAVAIRRPLDNLRNAGLIYSRTVYNKAPVMMMKLIELMGDEPFRTGIRRYLDRYAYGNATWDDLVAILDSLTVADLTAFSHVWVNSEGMPEIRLRAADGRLTVSQRDPRGRGLQWPQQFAATLRRADGRDTCITATLRDSATTLSIPNDVVALLPNTDGRGYGHFIPAPADMQWIIDKWHTVADDVGRLSLLMTLYENRQACLIADTAWLRTLMTGLPAERNPQIASSIVGYLPDALRTLDSAARSHAEQQLYHLAAHHPLPACRTRLMRMLSTTAASPGMLQQLLDVWEKQMSDRLNENDYIALAFHLAISLPQQSGRILAAQRSRITDPDRLRRFDFVARAATPDTAALDALFRSLLQPENRQPEPWAIATLSLLNHPLRQTHAVRYIRPALDVLEEVQRTGDIFMPRNWLDALLADHRTAEAYRELSRFLTDHPHYPPLLLDKIYQAAFPLIRAATLASVERLDTQ